MQSSNRNGEQNRDELDGIQRQINQKTNDSVESTRRMVNLVAESQEVGNNTMVQLDEQGEQLNRIENGLDRIHVEMNQAEKNLTNLQKCCGLCVLPWNRARRTRRPLSNSSTSNTTTEKTSPTTSEPQLRMAGEGMPQSGYIARITNDDREEEMDDNLQLVSSYLGNLKNIALDMNETIAGQTRQIDRISDKNDAGLDRVSAANKRTQEILRKA